MKRVITYGFLLIISDLLLACSLLIPVTISIPTALSSSTPSPTTTPSPDPFAQARSKIKHIIVIMQENRSFDNYFGTYPGADGLPTRNGQFTVCVNDPRTKQCIYPYHDSSEKNHGGPHGQPNQIADINGGKMDGFIAQAEKANLVCTSKEGDPSCGSDTPTDVMGYHDAREIPNYWTYGQNFVLQDHLFESVDSWSVPSHLFMVSEWSAKCTIAGDPMSCINNNESPDYESVDSLDPTPHPTPPDYAWTDLTYLLFKYKVSWNYYIQTGTEPDCANGSADCPPVHQNAITPGGMNPLPSFDTVKQDGQLANIIGVNNFYKDAQNGTLPTISWVIPSLPNSEANKMSIEDGQAWSTSLINAVLQGPEWNSSAIFLSWDDFGGYYDHMVPPRVDQNGYGLRLPGLVISPYARHGYIDHQVLSHDAYIKFIEDIFLGSQRLDPATDGRPDQRPDVRENSRQLGNLLLDFDFNQPPRPPLVLPLHPPPGPASNP